MNLLAPLGLAAAGLSIPLLVLYMLRSRRATIEVPSVLLWGDEDEFVSAALPWQRLTVTAALLLQLLALLLFALALARPFDRVRTVLGPHTVWVVDTSGSMAVAGRWEKTTEIIFDTLDDVSEEQLVSVVEAGVVPRVVVAFTDDPEAVRAAINSLQPSGGEADLSGAVTLARGLSTPDRASTILLVSDGDDEAALPGPMGSVRHILVDAVGDNIAITALNTDVPGQGLPRVFVEVTSFSARNEDVQLEILVDGLPISSEDLALEPGGRLSRVVPVDAGPGQTIEAVLIGANDALPADDASVIVLGEATTVTSAIVGVGSPFLETLLQALPDVVPATTSPADVLVIDVASAAAIDRPTWVIGPTEPPPGVTVVGRVDEPVITMQRPSEPLLEGVDLSELAIAEAAIVEAPGWYPIVAAGDVPLILLGDVDGQRVVYFTFDIVRSNLPVQVAFPILGARIMDYLAGSRLSASGTAPAGTPLTLVTPAGSVPVVTTPDGDRIEMNPERRSFTATGEPGLYTVSYEIDGVPVGGYVAARQFWPSESAGMFFQHTGDGVATAAAQDDGFLTKERAALVIAVLLGVMLAEWWIALGRPTFMRKEVPA
ncbi:MAG: VWA domain-containing protein [Actinobacteria bacterium]|nr:VWA domain-containing protein [Actinomycetota bacterium]